MVRLIAFFAYFIGYLIFSVPKLFKIKRLSHDMPVSKRDQIIHVIPKRWSRTIMKITGSNIKIEGKENIPEGPVLFVSNHVGDFDIPVLLGFIDKPFGFTSKVEVKKVPILSWMEVMNCVFLDRKDPRQAVRTIRNASELLKEGHSIVLFPEGTRSKGGPAGEFKTGGFRMAIDAKVPIVPISIKGTADIFEKNGYLVRPSEIHIVIGQPIVTHIESKHTVKGIAEKTRMVVLANLGEEIIA